ncbi:MAG: hypothetical protein O6837_14025 [Deltaproteobacteria bacterium]|nr:hypothetical protein [Deltaproteobacteria bacterium]MCZ6549213.1 hypothetical protein [Deltaproteobacteria bacterium]MCZ6561378.1 hypothetical protein [Deltaproteobacteria bacterium]MCZ6906649.1 hypothetical protein [Deltaproteobacteria bacterium]
MAKSPIIDIHAHFFPERYLKLLDEEGETFGIRLQRANPKGLMIEMNGGVQGPLKPAFTDLDLRLKETNRKRVDVHASFSRADQAKILGSNPARLLKFG